MTINHIDEGRIVASLTKNIGNGATAEDIVHLLEEQKGNRARIAMLVARPMRGREKIAFLREATRSSFADAILHDELASRLARIGNGEEAEAEAREGVRLAPRDPYCRNTLAGILLQNNKGEEKGRSTDEARYESTVIAGGWVIVSFACRASRRTIARALLRRLRRADFGRRVPIVEPLAR